MKTEILLVWTCIIFLVLVFIIGLGSAIYLFAGTAVFWAILKGTVFGALAIGALFIFAFFIATLIFWGK